MRIKGTYTSHAILANDSELLLRGTCPSDIYIYFKVVAFISNVIISLCGCKLRTTTIKFNYFLQHHAAGEDFPLKKDDYKEKTLLNKDHALLFMFIFMCNINRNLVKENQGLIIYSTMTKLLRENLSIFFMEIYFV